MVTRVAFRGAALAGWVHKKQERMRGQSREEVDQDKTYPKHIYTFIYFLNYL